MKRCRAVLVVICLLMVACAPSAVRTSRPPQSLVTWSEIASASLQEATAYRVLEQLRPNFLLARRGQGVAKVYLDGQAVGTTEYLRMLSAINVESIQYISPVDARARYGDGHDGGIIAVRSARQR